MTSIRLRRETRAEINSAWATKPLASAVSTIAGPGRTCRAGEIVVFHVVLLRVKILIEIQVIVVATARPCRSRHCQRRPFALPLLRPLAEPGRALEEADGLDDGEVAEGAVQRAVGEQLLEGCLALRAERRLAVPRPLQDALDCGGQGRGLNGLSMRRREIWRRGAGSAAARCQAAPAVSCTPTTSSVSKCLSPPTHQAAAARCFRSTKRSRVASVQHRGTCSNIK